MSELSLSLNKANNLLKKITKIVGSRSIYYNSEVVITSLIKNKKEFEANIKKHLEEKSQKLLEHISLIEDKHLLKETLFKENITSGLSSVLGQIEIEENKINLYEAIISSFTLEQDLMSTKIENLSDEIDKHNSLEQPRMSFNIYDKEDLKNKLSESRKRLSKLEDSKQKFNSNKKINITLSEYSMKLLGLE